MTRAHQLAAITRTISRHLAVYPSLQPAHRDLTDAAIGFDQAVERLELAVNDGLGAQSFDGGRGGGDTGSVPERLAGKRDPAADTLTELDTALRHLTEKVGFPRTRTTLICEDARSVYNIVQMWSPHAPRPKDLREVRTLNMADGCDHHITVKIHELASHHGTVSGNLSLPMALCDYCYWQVRRKGRLPTAEAMEKRHRTGKNELEPA